LFFLNDWRGEPTEKGDMTQPSDNFERKLAGELKGLYGAPERARAGDAQILSAARAAGEASVRGRWRWRVGLGLAAAVAVAAGVMWGDFFGHGNVAMPARSPAAPQADRAMEAHAPAARTGDIQDAYFVARELKQHHSLPILWDSTGDGLVDQNDVQALAVAAVRLPVEKGEVR
jgi:hypothetical protein